MGVLTTIQDSALSLIQGDRYYARIQVLTEQIGDIRNKINTALAKLGICAIVMTPKGEADSPGAPGPILNPLELHIDICELVMTNRGETGSRQPASDVAEHTAWLLHYPNHAGNRQDPYPFLFQKFYVIPDGKLLIYRIEFRTRGALAGIITTP